MTTLLPPLSDFAIGRVVGNRVIIDPVFWNWIQQSLVPRVGGIEAPSITELQATDAAFDARLTIDEAASLTATYDDDNRIATVVNKNGAILEIDELFCWDINYWLTPDEIEDSRSPTGPKINLTTKIQHAIDVLTARFVGIGNPAKPSASRGGLLRFHHSYLIDGLSVDSAIGIVGDNMRDTIFVQSQTPNGHMLNGLATNGAASGARSPYWVLENFSIRGTPSLVAPDGTVPSGIYLQTGVTDPLDVLAGAALGHNAVLMSMVSVVGMSGSGFYCPIKRHAPKLRFCFFSGCGGIDTSVAQDGSGYSPNVYIGADSDAEMLHCGSGGGKGHSVQIHGCETAQVYGGDYWASSNAALGYRSHYWTGMDYGSIVGADINGALEYHGSGLARSAQFRIINNNFRFRPSSFGDDDPDTPGTQPAPLQGYILLLDANGSESIGNTFTPYYDKTGPVVARPQYIYYCLGDTIHHAADRLQDVASNDWPAGADAMGVLDPSPTEATTITNNWGTVNLACWADSSKYNPAFLAQFLRFPEGINHGIIGRQDGSAPTVGCMGEEVFAKINEAAAVALTSGVTINLLSITLTPGEWDVSGSAQFEGTGASATAFDVCAGPTSATIVVTEAGAYSGFRVPFTTITGRFLGQRVGPLRVSVTTSTTYYLCVAATFSAGAVAAYGRIRARRWA